MAHNKTIVISKTESTASTRPIKKKPNTNKTTKANSNFLNKDTINQIKAKSLRINQKNVPSAMNQQASESDVDNLPIESAEIINNSNVTLHVDDYLEYKSKFKRRVCIFFIFLAIFAVLLAILAFLMVYFSIPCLFIKCHPNAQCINLPFTLKSKCLCNYGYGGDGVTHCEECGLTFPNVDSNKASSDPYLVYIVFQMIQKTIRISNVSQTMPKNFTNMTMFNLVINETSKNYTSYCIGTLINRKTVLTTANCALNINEVGSNLIYSNGSGNATIIKSIGKTWAFAGFESILGVLNQTDYYSILGIGVDEVQIHPSFNSTTLENNIAILKLKNLLNLNDRIQMACLPRYFAKIGIDYSIYPSINSTNSSSDDSNSTYNYTTPAITTTQPVIIQPKLIMLAHDIANVNEFGAKKITINNREVAFHVYLTNSCIVVNDSWNMIWSNSTLNYTSNPITPRPKLSIKFDNSSMICAALNTSKHISLTNSDLGTPLIGESLIENKLKLVVTGLYSYNNSLITIGTSNILIYTNVNYYLDWIINYLSY